MWLIKGGGAWNKRPTRLTTVISKYGLGRCRDGDRSPVKGLIYRACTVHLINAVGAGVKLTYIKG